MQSTIVLREYQMRNPDLAAYPTLSQSGALALVLVRQQEKAAARIRRRVRRQVRRESLRALFRAVRHAVTVLPFRNFRLQPFAPPLAVPFEKIILPLK